MVIEKEIIPFWIWVNQNVGAVALALLIFGGISIFFGFLAGSFRHGPFESIRMTWRTVSTGINELLQISSRRIVAIARLTFLEAIRRRVFVVLIVFVVLLMFAGWFLDRDSNHPARLYMNFVFATTNLLVILLSIFLSCFSIPNDVRHKTIYTVVTKPVRGWDLVLGRMAGFCAVGTVLILVMWASSLIFVWRGGIHDHAVQTADMIEKTETNDEGVAVTVANGQSSPNRSHRHGVRVNEDGSVFVEPAHDHTHHAEVVDHQIQLKKPQGDLLARVPIMGRLRFLNRQGVPGDGINPGYEWKYRKYIEGGTAATAIWRFKNIKREDFKDGFLPFELTLRVFRTYQGKIEEGLSGTIEVVRPAPLDKDGVPILGRDGKFMQDDGLRSIPLPFTARDQEVHEFAIPQEITAVNPDGTTEEVDLFDQLVNPNGELEIWIQCMDRAQYFGMAPADLYLRSTNQPFWLNFSKGYFSIWSQMIVVTCFGVTFSTFLNGAVAMLATLASIVVGFFREDIFRVSSGEIPGGGPLESLVRMLWQQNQMVEFNDNIATAVMRNIDAVLMEIIDAVGYVMPPCGEFNTSRFVAYGYNVPADLVGQHFAMTVMYTAVLSCAAYFFFKTREIAA